MAISDEWFAGSIVLVGLRHVGYPEQGGQEALHEFHFGEYGFSEKISKRIEKANQ